MGSIYKRLNPKCLYPMCTVESVNPERLKTVLDRMRIGRETGRITVISYGGFYFILEGYYEMLAANILKMSAVDVEVRDRAETEYYKADDNLEIQLKKIGMNALYDFEAIGKFQYGTYPEYYK